MLASSFFPTRASLVPYGAPDLLLMAFSPPRKKHKKTKRARAQKKKTENQRSSLCTADNNNNNSGDALDPSSSASPQAEQHIHVKSASVQSLAEFERELRNPQSHTRLLGISQEEFLALSPERKKHLLHQLHSRTLVPLAASPKLVRETKAALLTHSNKRREQLEVSPGPGHYFDHPSPSPTAAATTKRVVQKRSGVSDNYDDDDDPVSAGNNNSSKMQSSRRRRQQQEQKQPRSPRTTLKEEMQNRSAAKFCADVSWRNSTPGVNSYDAQRGEKHVDKFASAPAISFGSSRSSPSNHHATVKSLPAVVAPLSSVEVASPLRSSIRGFSMSGRGHELSCLSTAGGGALMACQSPLDTTPAPGAYGKVVITEPPRLPAGSLQSSVRSVASSAASSLRASAPVVVTAEAAVKKPQPKSTEVKQQQDQKKTTTTNKKPVAVAPKTIETKKTAVEDDDDDDDVKSEASFEL